MRMGVNHWEWEGMGLKRISHLFVVSALETQVTMSLLSPLLFS